MRRLFILALLLTPLSAKADQPRTAYAFVSPNGKYEFRYESGPTLERSPNGKYEPRLAPGPVPQHNWALVEKATGEVRYRVAGEFGSRTVLVSDDGVNLVVVDDFSEREPGRDLDVLLFYRDGTLLKTYSLGDLLGDVSNVSSSVSHFQWFFKPEALSVIDSRLKLETFELVRYEFDARTGDLLKKETNPVLSEDSVYVYGKVKKLGGGRFEIEVCQRVQGAVPPGGKIEFAADRGDEFHVDDFSYSVVIRDGKLVFKHGEFLNSCNYRRSARQ